MNESSDEPPKDGISPEQRLEGPTRLIIAGIESIKEMETVRECVPYENTHQNRSQILYRLEQKAEELRTND